MCVHLTAVKNDTAGTELITSSDKLNWKNLLGGYSATDSCLATARTVDKPHALAELNCPISSMAPWKLESAMWAEGRSLLHANSGRLCLLLSCSLPLDGSTVTANGSELLQLSLRKYIYLVNLSSLYSHSWYGLPLPRAFKIWHKKWSLKAGVSMHRWRPTENFLFSCIVFRVLCPFLQLSHQLQLFSISKGCLFFLIECHYSTWSECSSKVVEKVGTSLTQTSYT